MKKPFKPLFKTAAVAFSALVMLCGFCLTGHDAEIKADAASRVDLTSRFIRRIVQTGGNVQQLLWHPVLGFCQ